VANAVVAKVDGAGQVCLYATATTQVVVDVDGAYSPAGNDTFGGVAPARVTDTRATGRPAPGEPYAVTVTGGDVPGDARSVVLNVTVTEPSAEGYLTVWPCGAAQPWASNLNFPAGRTVANAVAVGVGTGGQVCLASPAAAHLVIDVDGYHAPT
jgi:hypothetical protein